MVTIDFEFPTYSRTMGEFLLYLYDNYPTGKAEEVGIHYPYKPDTQYLSVTVPEDIAILMKLKFSAELRVRPLREKNNNDDDYYKTSLKKSIKNYYIKESYTSKMYKPELSQKITQTSKEIFNALKDKFLE